MGKVVKLETSARKGQAGRKEPQARVRRSRSKTALVMGGGGITGAVYEIGALRALDLLSVNRSVNDFDIYVGTSAGAFVASLASNGVTPEEMMRVVDRQIPVSFREINVNTLMRPDYKDFIQRGLLFPLRVAELAFNLARNFNEVSLMDAVIGLAEGLPPGLYSGIGVHRYLKDVFSDPDRVNDFRLLEKELFLTATDLDTCERVVMGGKEWDDIPISKAVAASTALPMVYKPVKIKGRELVDGGIRSTTNIDVAVKAGAKFIIVVNPMVPYVNDFKKKIPTMFGSRVRRVSDMGFPQIGFQTFKLMAYSRLHDLAEEWPQRYPGVDIIMIEPDLTDELMFGTSIMNFSARVDIARHGFESVTLKLAKQYRRYKQICERHGIEIEARRVNRVLKQAEEEKEKTRAWRRILEQTTSTLLRQSSS